jgi:hypothetical protein
MNLICRYCGQIIDQGQEAKTFAYWSKTPDFCHLPCQKEGERIEAIDCQKIDKDCNDCIFFQRGNLAQKQIHKIKNQKGELKTIIFQPQFSYGNCSKFNKPVMAQPNKWSGLACFKHRSEK